MEAIAIRLEAIATKGKKLLGTPGLTTNSILTYWEQEASKIEIRRPQGKSSSFSPIERLERDSCLGGRGC